MRSLASILYTIMLVAAIGHILRVTAPWEFKSPG
jgi:hypothetical protein